MPPSTVIPGLVTTIIPVYNRAVLVREAVVSVLNQTYRPLELILVDDGSTDDSPAALATLAAAHPAEIRIIRQANAGPGQARETGRLAARGEFIQYLDSDDWILPGKFAAQVSALRARPECGIAYCKSRYVDESGMVLEEPSKWTGRRMDRLFPALLIDRWWHTHTPLYRRTITDAIGAWPPHRPEDWDMDARAGALNTPLAYCDEVLSCQRGHRGEGRVSEGPRRAYRRDEAWFLPRLHDCAVQAGINPMAPEMQHFCRWAFALSRQLAIDGEPELGKQMLALALRSNPEPHWDLKLMACASSVFGFATVARAVEVVRGVAGKRPGAYTIPAP